MWYVPILNICKWLFQKLPLETILVRALAWSIKKVCKEDDVNKLKKTIQHCNESLDLFEQALLEKENNIIKGVEIKNLPKISEILDAWSDMKSVKDLEDKL